MDMSLVTARVPGVIVAGCLGLALGAGAGLAVMKSYGYHWTKEPALEVSQEEMANRMGKGGPSADKGGPKGKDGPGGGMPKAAGGPGGGGGAAARGPNPKTQLVGLITKLDQLTHKPLTIELTADQKKKVHEQLQGLSESDELSDDEAKKRLEALKEILGNNADVLEVAGFRFSPPSGRPQQPPPNPFKDEETSKHLKSLETQLAKGPA